VALKIPLIALMLVLAVFTATAHAEPPFVDAVTGMELVFIRGGCYKMGDPAGDSNDRPLHEVCVSAFYIGKYDVTNQQFRQFRPEHDSGKFEGISVDDDEQPVVNVSWEDAVAFAKWLSQRSGKTYRLPTEAEWEYAARAGTTTTYFWGNNPDDACKYANVADLSAKKRWKKWTVFNCDDKFLISASVGSFLPNGYGLYDMLGNVWQWVEDVYNKGAYTKLPKYNPAFEDSGVYRVIRGGGWSNGPLGVRVSHRVPLTKDFGHHALGFRLVMTK
jgi:sulfatase modifying factor 1